MQWDRCLLPRANITFGGVHELVGVDGEVNGATMVACCGAVMVLMTVLTVMMLT